MQPVAPEVYLIAETNIDNDGLDAMLGSLGAGDWQTDAPSGAEKLIEVAGRLCYLSFNTELNPNVTRVRQGNNPYIKNIIKSGHGSVLEHATVSFALLNVTPVLTHELVRHRAGTAFSQQSGRYCRIDELSFYWPDAFDRALEAGALEPAQVAQFEREALSLLEKLEAFQQRLSRLTNIDDMEAFAVKKELTSAFRRFAPYGLATKIIFTANHRALRHMIAVRNDVHAEEEVRRVFYEIAVILKDRYPNIYQDMELDPVETHVGEEPVWRFANDKV